MAEHIRKQAVLNLIDEFQYNHESNTWGVTKDGVVVLKPDTLDKLHEAVKAIPPADVVEVVRCEDCKHRFVDEIVLSLTSVPETAWVCDIGIAACLSGFYCGRGKRKDDQQCK